MIGKSIETRQSWVVASVALVAMGFSFGAPWIAVVALKAIAAELGGARSTPALAGSLSWFGVGFGGLVMGHIADRIGVRWTVMFGALMICVGLAISSLGAPWQLYVGHGLFIGFLGNGGINAPLYVYVSRWFDRRRGSALALISSGAYLAGAIWPPIFEQVIAVLGWRQTMWSFGLVEIAVIVPIAAIFLTPPPDQKYAGYGAYADPKPGPVLGWPPERRVLHAVRRGLSVLHADGAAADPSHRLLLRPRHRADPRRRHALGGAGHRLPVPAIVGPVLRPDGRARRHWSCARPFRRAPLPHF